MFGRIAVEKGLLTETQLSRAVRFQEELRSLGLEKPLGEILVADGILKPQDVLQVLRLQKINENKRTDKRFLKIAVANGFLSKTRAEEALKKAKERNYHKPVAHILLQDKTLTKAQVGAITGALERRHKAKQTKDALGVRSREKTEKIVRASVPKVALPEPTPDTKSDSPDTKSDSTDTKSDSKEDSDDEIDEKLEKDQEKTQRFQVEVPALPRSTGKLSTGKLGESIDLEVGDLPPDRERRTRDLLFAAVALRDGLVLVPEIERALQQQLTFPDEPPLETILVERGILGPKECKAVDDALTASRAEKLAIPGYRISDVLGRGATSIVLRARHELIDREVAIKLFRTEHMASADAETLVEEARTLAKIHHPNVVGLYEVGRVHRRIYYVMELVEGRSLMETIRRRKKLPEREALGFARDVAQALDAFREAGLVHRDVKPQNIMVTREGLAKLTDLGLARDADAKDADPNMIYGTPHVIAPEQATGGKLDIRTDLYGLGATLYHCLTGSPPYEGQDPLAIVLHHLTKDVPDARKKSPEVSDATASFVQQLMAKDAKDRPQSPREVVATIEKILREIDDPPWPTVPAADDLEIK